MDQHNSGHGGYGNAHGTPSPAPSFWALLVGLAALVTGVSLIWWSRDDSSNFAGPLLGLSAAMAVVAAGAWAYEDRRSKHRVDSGLVPATRDARYTQVVTFAIADGQLEAARAEDGVLSAIERCELQDMDGFQDLRVIASPSETGPSQVLVETTWSGREALTTYEETRRTLLDVLNVHAGQVVPGTVQVFDMEVVRDTKDTSFKFGFGTAATLLVSLAVGGIALGAGITAFQNDNAAANGNVTPAPSDGGLAIVATDNKFDKTTLTAPPDTDVTVSFKNAGKVQHNIHFLDKKGGQDLAPGAAGNILPGGQSETLTFKTPAAGTYYFQCDVHPDQMTGTFKVDASAAAPAAGGASAAAAQTLVAKGTKFDKSSIQAQAGKEFSLTIDNKDTVKHNIHVLDKKGGEDLAPGAAGKLVDGGLSDTIKFTPPAAGKFYFQCDVHPDQMFGDFVVK